LKLIPERGVKRQSRRQGAPEQPVDQAANPEPHGATRGNLARTVANFGARHGGPFTRPATAVVMTMKPTRPTKPKRSTIPCYSPDGTSLGYRTLAAAQRLVAEGFVRPAYGRKGHLRAIWLLRDDGSNPIHSRAHNGTRYSYIETLENGRCWQLRRLVRRDATAPDGLPVSPRDPFLQVIQECMAPSRDTLPTDALANAKIAAAKSASTASPRPSQEGQREAVRTRPATAKPAGTEAAGQGQASHDRGSQGSRLMTATRTSATATPPLPSAVSVTCNVE